MNSARAKVFDVINDYDGRPFVYGESDCCQFVADCVEAVTGLDYAEAFGLYAGEKGAQRLIQQYGGLFGLLSRAFGEPNGCHEPFGVALTSRTGSEMAGFIYKGRLVVRTGTGVTDWPVEFADEVWQICHKQ